MARRPRRADVDRRRHRALGSRRSPAGHLHASLAHPDVAPSPFPQSYGTPADGWFVSSLSGHLSIWHDGEVGGFQTINATFPNDGIDIIVLTNDGLNSRVAYLTPDAPQNVPALVVTSATVIYLAQTLTAHGSG